MERPSYFRNLTCPTLAATGARGAQGPRQLRRHDRGKPLSRVRVT